MEPQTSSGPTYFPLPLQISADAWRELGLSLPYHGHPPSSPIFSLRLVAERLHRRHPEREYSPAALNLLGTLNRAFRHLADRYLEQRRCRLGADGLEVAGHRHAVPKLRPTLEGFVHLFPPAFVIRGGRPEAFLETPEAWRSAMVELYVLAVQSRNPAAAAYAELHDDASLERQHRYRELLQVVDGHLREAEVSGRLGGSLLALLEAPIKAAPDSLSAQVRFVKEHWTEFLPEDLLQELLSAFDLLAEERQMRGFGPGPMPVPKYAAGDYPEPEAFSPEADWMPNVVLIAKSIYVWLDQLSRKYGRSLTRLDEIPDAELDLLARWGFNALWLIGLWERSPASQKIKRIMGNPEAVSSAYSLYDYVTASDLGGDQALADLNRRCLQRGIRLGCDVVPNHTGIYSRWVREHPDWFIQTSYPPYPSYRFTGPDLSFDAELSLFIEDGYWNHTDAAVVFKRVDNRTGDTRYIYHGNDGTHMPWNDTAQLDFLLPEVRETVIRTIIEVARTFRIIRFDAAMTLAKKHFQRLWYPQPGGGAGVPSRAEHALAREDFDRAFPVEFWREVVDRVAAEVPDTLLLAEAFWLMEGYFVRTLGMHRVYNSAFMNMLKLEENAKYRSVLKNVLEFNPEILKRFVNFMNNPDEATAVEQFGKEGKYFGVAVLLATLPGTPMFGHGQVEGYREKYGMEYRRAYWEENPDEGFVRHHEAQIFPLLHRRYLFSGSRNFVLFDFQSGGHVNEDVFAYSNREGDERALVVYHNRFAETGGWIRNSVPKTVRGPEGESRQVRQSLAEALDLSGGDGIFYGFRDHRSGLEYLRPGRELAEQGLHVHLEAFQYYVFLDFREFRDTDGTWGELYRDIGERPVASLDWECRRLRYADLHRALERLLQPAEWSALAAALRQTQMSWRQKPAATRFDALLEEFLEAMARRVGGKERISALGARIKDDLDQLRRLLALGRRARKPWPFPVALGEAPKQRKPAGSDGMEAFRRIALPWLLLRRLSELAPAAEPAEGSALWMEEFLLDYALQRALPPETAAEDVLLVGILVRRPPPAKAAPLASYFRRLLEDPAVLQYLRANDYGGVRWFNQERLEALVRWICFAAAFSATPGTTEDKALRTALTPLFAWAETTVKTAREAGYRLDSLQEKR